MIRFRLLFCILCLLFSATFFMTAKESDVDSEMHDVELEAKTQTNSSNRKKSSDDGVPDTDIPKVKKRKSGGSSSEQKMLLTAGGGLGLVLPGAETVHDGYNNWNNGDCKTNTFVMFGFNVLGNVTFTYEIKEQWSIGGEVNLGYNLMGGPHALYEHRYKNEKYSNTYRGLGKMYHSFITDMNFMARSPQKKGGNLILEGGVRLMPTWGFLVYREDGETKIGENAYSKKKYSNPYPDAENAESFFAYYGTETCMMAGPNFFVGIDYYIRDCFDVIGGLRFGAVFGCANTYYWNEGIMDRSYINSIITIAFEAKFNWYKRF